MKILSAFYFFYRFNQFGQYFLCITHNTVLCSFKNRSILIGINGNNIFG